MTKNISLLLNGILLLAVAYLYFLQFSKKSGPEHAPILPPASAGGGVKIAYVNVDTLDLKYEWLKQQRAAMEQRLDNIRKSLGSKKDVLMKDMAAFQKKYESGTVPPAELEKEYSVLTQRQQKLAEEENRLSNQLGEEQQKTNNELMAKLEAQLKSLQSQIGYDYILSYSKGGGQVLLANDSLDITRQVLELLNAQGK